MALTPSQIEQQKKQAEELLFSEEHKLGFAKALFFGHSHKWDLKEKDGLHLVNLPAVAYPFAKDQPTGWVDCNLSVTGATLELRAHNDQHPAHGKKTELKWRA